MMKAVVFHEHGDLDKLQLAEMETPAPAPGEARVRVEACALNHLDIWVRLGRPVPIPMPHILGCDVAGTVDETGAGVEGLQPGTRVVVAPGLSCGQCEYCLAGNDSACDQFKILGFQTQGGYAEYVCVPRRNIIPVSNRLTFEEWSSIPLVFLTAWHMLFTRAGLKTGETVLVQAAGSGIGAAAIQLAKLAGANVVATAGTAAKLDHAKELGADHVINYRERDFVSETLEITGGRGADVVFEHIGGDTFEKSLDALAKTGRIANCGVTSGPEVKINLSKLYFKQQSIHGSLMGSLAEQKTVIRLAEEGKIKPVIDKVFPLEEARAAQQRMLDRANFGKIVLKV